jgi:serine/threonine protein kinase
MTDLKSSQDEKNSPRKVGQYILKETLGKGGYSWVKKGVDEKSNVRVALKFMARAEKNWEKEQAQQVRTEIKSLMRINHPNVMKLYAYNLNCKYPEKSGQSLSTILLVLEYCPGGELFDILYYTNQLDEVTARTYFIQMMKAIEACHKAGIIHRDIKPQNLLMDANYQLKLTDFGLSFLGKEGVDVDKIVMNTSFVGTRGYQAPELLKREKYQKPCDIFSAGVVLFILLTGYPPFEQAIKSDKWFNPLARMDVDKFWKKHKGCGVDSKSCQDLLSSMMAYKPYKRPSIDEILKHPWVTGEKAKVYKPKELKRVLRQRHKSTRDRRRRDKKKMKDMQHSIKKRSKDKLTDFTKLPSCPLKTVDEYVPTFMSFIAEKEYLPEAYWLAKHVCDFALDNNTYTTAEVDPWTLVTAVKVILENGNIREYLIQVCIVELEGLEKYSFTFKRLQGDSLEFRKIWVPIENLLLTQRTADGKCPLFQDMDTDMDEVDNKNNDLDELQTMKVVGAETKKVENVSVLV